MYIATIEAFACRGAFPILCHQAKRVVKSSSSRNCFRQNAGKHETVRAERDRKRKQAYNMVNARMLKELQALAPWTWDKVLPLLYMPAPCSPIEFLLQERPHARISRLSLLLTTAQRQTRSRPTCVSPLHCRSAKSTLQERSPFTTLSG